MSKINYFYLYLALALIFSACDKAVPDQIVDENMMGKKSFVWVGNDLAKEYLSFSYVPISASAFSNYGGKPFNNGCEETANKGIKLCRDPQNKGNGNVTVFFGPEAMGVDGKYANCEYKLAVKYKGSLNAEWTFNVKACVDYCAKNGPISLYVGEKMGSVTQVRYDGKGAYICEEQTEPEDDPCSEIVPENREMKIKYTKKYDMASVGIIYEVTCTLPGASDFDISSCKVLMGNDSFNAQIDFSGEEPVMVFKRSENPGSNDLSVKLYNENGCEIAIYQNRIPDLPVYLVTLFNKAIGEFEEGTLFCFDYLLELVAQSGKEGVDLDKIRQFINWSTGETITRGYGEQCMKINIVTYFDIISW